MMGCGRCGGVLLQVAEKFGWQRCPGRRQREGRGRSPGNSSSRLGQRYRCCDRGATGLSRGAQQTRPKIFTWVLRRRRKPLKWKCRSNTDCARTPNRLCSCSSRSSHTNRGCGATASNAMDGNVPIVLSPMLRLRMRSCCSKRSHSSVDPGISRKRLCIITKNMGVKCCI